MIVGVDEVGRGCLAGPVCVTAVAMPDGLMEAVDSKKLTAVNRTLMALQIRRYATQIGIGWASHTYIDAYGMTAALRYAAQQALENLDSTPELILLDGNTNYLDDERVVTIIDGDEKVPLIAAASVIAKVARDKYMMRQHSKFPGYGFARHVGYGTAAHREALTTLGPCAIHRLSFAPLKGLLDVN